MPQIESQGGEIVVTTGTRPSGQGAVAPNHLVKRAGTLGHLSTELLLVQIPEQRESKIETERRKVKMEHRGSRF